jgi:hypothetical protein
LLASREKEPEGVLMAAGRSPDYILRVGLEDSKYPARVGCAWYGEDGRIAIKLDPGVAIVGGAKVEIRLVPFEKKQKDDERFF